VAQRAVAQRAVAQRAVAHLYLRTHVLAEVARRAQPARLLLDPREAIQVTTSERARALRDELGDRARVYLAAHEQIELLDGRAPGGGDSRELHARGEAERAQRL
jgi:hypothetical protein